MVASHLVGSPGPFEMKRPSYLAMRGCGKEGKTKWARGARARRKKETREAEKRGEEGRAGVRCAYCSFETSWSHGTTSSSTPRVIK